MAAAMPAAAAQGTDGASVATTDDDPPIFEVFRVLPQWVVRSEKRAAGYVACDARGFDEDHDTALGLRLDGSGGFSVTLASAEELLPPGFRRPNTVSVAMPYGEAWRFDAEMQGGIGQVALVPGNGFGLAYALTRGWQVGVQIGTLELRFRLRGVAEAVTALGQCVRLFVNPNLDLPPLPQPPADDDGG